MIPSVKNLLCALAVFACLLGGGLLTSSSHAANFTTSVTQGPGQHWNGAIWNPEEGGAAVAPTSGNTYTILENGILIGNLSANSRVRNPTSDALASFAGDSLILRTNTELRMKGVGTTPTSITLDFPGVGENPGLIIDNGFLNLADVVTYTITGVVNVPSKAFFDAASDHGGFIGTGVRRIDLQAKLTGNGTMVFLQFATNSPQVISGNANTFSGKWLVTSGWLLASGLNSLGTNDIIIDPAAPLGLNPALSIVEGPALLELGYDINSSGALLLVNGGLMKLHQNCTFGVVCVEGQGLGVGTHSYSALAAAYPNTFLPGGSGSITVTSADSPPNIYSDPKPTTRLAGTTATFSAVAVGSGPMTLRWRKNNVNLTDDGRVAGATTPSLVINNLSLTDAGSYDLVVTNAAGFAASAAVTLTVVPATGAALAVATNKPVGYWQLEETDTPPAPAPDYVGGYDGTYGASVVNGWTGPQAADGFPGFGSANKAVLFYHGFSGSRITLPALRLNTNTVTFTSWIYPTGSQVDGNAVLFCRGGSTLSGLHYGAFLDQSGSRTLTYTWDSEAAAPESWNSLLAPPINQWSFVALSVSATNATIHMINANGLASSTHTWSHVAEPFDAALMIGDDNSSGAKVFNGVIDDVAVFKRSLSRQEIVNLYSAASSVSLFRPLIVAQSTSRTGYTGQTLGLNVKADGTHPLHYQWEAGTGGNFVALSDGGNISGATASTLTIANLGLGNAADYRVIITNSQGSATSSIIALTVEQAGAPEIITMAGQQGVNADWETASSWSDGLAASLSAISKPGSTYEVLPGARLRTPNLSADSTFPGSVLTVQGNGVWINNPGASAAVGEVRFKQSVPTGRVVFNKLVMNGGQLDLGSAGEIVIAGEVNILANAPFYGSSAANAGFRIDGQLTGNGTIEYRGYNLSSFNTNFTYNLSVAGTSNTFSGRWNIVLGTLLGLAPNSLGTNDITIGVNGALEAAYDINNPQGSLTLNGRMFLHENHTFKNVTVAGIELPPGTYTFAQLNTAYPTQFPAAWTRQFGSAVSTGSGSITVWGAAGPPVILTMQPSGSNFELSWPYGVLLEADELAGPWITNSSGSPYIVTPALPKKFYRVRVQ